MKPTAIFLRTRFKYGIPVCERERRVPLTLRQGRARAARLRPRCTKHNDADNAVPDRSDMSAKILCYHIGVKAPNVAGLGLRDTRNDVRTCAVNDSSGVSPPGQPVPRLMTAR
ncbi:unnamed protein product, partial [Brenthis ino]